MELREYQKQDALFLSNLETGACFNEQRTGKTPTILEVVRLKGFKKVLIISPNSAIPQWAAEYNAWLHQPCEAALGTRTKKELAIRNWEHGLVISYDSIKATKTSSGFVDLVLKQKPDVVILDEAHRIKDPKSANAKAAFKLMKVPNRYVLTATPAHGKPEEVYSLLHFIKPKLYPNYWHFVNTYFKVVTVTLGNTGRSFKDIRGFLPGMKTALQQQITLYSTQRKRKEVMPWLPDKDYQKVYLQPTAKQTKYLEDLQKFFETEDIVTQGVLDRLIRYRQICLAPQLLGLIGNSPKLDWIKTYLAEYPEKQVIIFTKFTSFIKILKEHLQKESIGCIIGSTPVQKRAELVQQFQNKTKRILLINIDAGKEALTLDAADVTIFTDKYPPYGDIAQAEDRFVATTKNKADKEHTIYELILKGTYDEELYKLVEKRATDTDVINNYKKYLKKE